MWFLGTSAVALGAALLLSLPAGAQDLWRVGVRLGANSSNVQMSGLHSAVLPSGRSTLTGGLVVERRLVEGLAVESGLLVLQRRWVTDYPFYSTAPVTFAAQEETTLRYLEIPVLLKAMFGQGRLRPWIAAGPAFEFLLSAQGDLSSSGDAGGVIPPFSASGSRADFFNDVVVGFEAAAGLDYRLDGRTKLHLDVRWEPGLSNLMASRPIPGQEFFDTKFVRSDDVRIVAGVSLGY